MATTAVPTRLPFGLTLPDSLSALSERDFRIVWSGQAVSLTGTWMQMVAQALLVLELWDSPFALGVMSFANAMPTLLVTLFGGVLADTADKRKILIVTQVIMAMTAALVGVLVVTDNVEYWMLICVTIALGVVIGYDMPAYGAFMPELVPPERIGQAVALNSSTFHGSRMVGPAVAGVVIKAFGFAGAYFLNALSFVAVIGSLLLVRTRHAPDDRGPRVGAIQGLKEGIRHARARPNVQAMLLLTGVNTMLVFPIIAVLMPSYVKGVLDSGAGTLAAIMAASGVGSMLGALALVWWPDELRVVRIWGGALVAPVALLVLAVTREPAVAVAMSGVLSLAFSSQLGLVQMILQESTPNEFRGRVMSLHGMTFTGTLPFAGLGSAALAELIGLPALIVLFAALFGVVSFVTLRFFAGGIDEVVRRSAREYEIIAAG
jgi:MFS family permease